MTVWRSGKTGCFETSIDGDTLENIGVETIECDVAVIGGGLAGMTAALEAKQNENRVFLFMKGKPGFSGSSSFAGGGFAACLGADDTPSCHAEDTLSAGRFVNDPQLVETFAKAAPDGIRYLEKLGVKFGKTNDDFALLRVGGHRKKRGIRCAGGGTKQMMEALHRRVLEKDVKIFNDCPIIELLTDEESIHGLIGLDARRKRFYQIACRTAVIATGGAGGLYPLTSMPGDLMGDGCAMALRHGLSLKDMEFIQFTPTALAYPPELQGTSTGGMLLAEGAQLTNRQGQRFMEKYDPQRMEASTRDILARAIHSEILSGNGTTHGGVHLHLSTIKRDLLEKNAGHFLQRLARHGIDPLKGPLEIAPAVHFFMGGIKINSQCETDLKGIFACAEAASGLHGANRLSSNGLSEAVVFGRIAGREAGRLARTMSGQPMKSPVWDGFKSEGRRKSSIPISETDAICKALRQCMINVCGLQREAQSLRSGLDELKGFSNQIALCAPEDGYERLKWVMACNLILLGQAVVLSALTREESRGAQFRTDYPKQDDKNWKRNIEIRLVCGELSLTTPAVSV